MGSLTLIAYVVPGAPTGTPTPPVGDPNAPAVAPLKTAFEDAKALALQLLAENWQWVLFFVVLYLIVDFAPIVWSAYRSRRSAGRDDAGWEA